MRPRGYRGTVLGDGDVWVLPAKPGGALKFYTGSDPQSAVDSKAPVVTAMRREKNKRAEKAETGMGVDMWR